jgi:hypothetical protein
LDQGPNQLCMSLRSMVNSLMDFQVQLFELVLMEILILMEEMD